MEADSVVLVFQVLVSWNWRWRCWHDGLTTLFHLWARCWWHQARYRFLMSSFIGWRWNHWNMKSWFYFRRFLSHLSVGDWSRHQQWNNCSVYPGFHQMLWSSPSKPGSIRSFVQDAFLPTFWRWSLLRLCSSCIALLFTWKWRIYYSDRVCWAFFIILEYELSALTTNGLEGNLGWASEWIFGSWGPCCSASKPKRSKYLWGPEAWHYTYSCCSTQYLSRWR
mgnify:CR=1 FL=1